MKSWIIFFIACAFLFFSVGPAMSDEISDFGKKIEMLQKTIDELKGQVNELKEKQEAQAEAHAEKAEEIDDLSEDVEALETLPEQMAAQLSKGVNIGGHFKAFMLDRSQGQRNDIDQNNNLSAGISDVWLYFSKRFNDWLSIDIAPRIEVLAAATPALGADISRATSASVKLGLDEAYISLRVPWELDLKVGAFYPMFSEEYARQTWWHEQYNGNNGLMQLQSWRSNGVQVYRNFDFEEFSLPVYLYWLNGDNSYSRYVDNNGGKNLLAHVAPEFFGGRFKVMGSVGFGKWDDNDKNGSLQWALESEAKYKGISLLAGYLHRGRDGVPLTGGNVADGDNKGWYVRGMYTFNSKWRALIKYSDVDLSFASTTMLTDNYKTVTFAANYWIAGGSTIIPQIAYVDARRSDGSEKLEYWRYTLGWRTTF